MPWVDWIEPSHSPFSGNDHAIHAFEYTTELIEMNSVAGMFTWVATWLKGIGEGPIYGGIKSQSNQFIHQGIGNTSIVKPGNNFSTSAQYEALTNPVEDRHIDGVELIADPAVSPPRWGIRFENPDAIGYTAKIFATRDSFTLPVTLKYRMEKAGKVLNPVGNFSKDAVVTMDWVPLPEGEYAIWDEYIQIDAGPFSHIARRYIKESVRPAFRWPPLFYLNEFTNAPLTNSPLEVKYSNLRIYDALTGRWHTLSRWKLVIAGAFNPVQDIHGWSTEKPSKLVFKAGHASDSTTQRRQEQRHYFRDFKNQFCSTNYPSPNTLTDLLYQGYTTVSFSGASVTGEIWKKSFAAHPSIYEDAVRGFWWFQPSGSLEQSALVYTCTEEGVHTVIGDFARGNPTQNQGDGVTAKIFHDNLTTQSLIFQVAVGANHVVNPDSPFTGTSNQHFSIQPYLKVGERLIFAVSPNSTHGFDETAFQVWISWPGILFASDIPPDILPPIAAFGETRITLKLDSGAEIDLGVQSTGTSVSSIRTKPLDYIGNEQRHSTRRKQVQGIRFEFDPKPDGNVSVELFTRNQLSDTPVSHGVFPVSTDGIVHMRLPNRRYYEFELTVAGGSTRWGLTALEIFGVPSGDRRV